MRGTESSYYRAIAPTFSTVTYAHTEEGIMELRLSFFTGTTAERASSKSPEGKLLWNVNLSSWENCKELLVRFYSQFVIELVVLESRWEKTLIIVKLKVLMIYISELENCPTATT